MTSLMTVDNPLPESHDAIAPAEIARKVQQVGVVKANTNALSLLALAGLAGAYISIGALFYLVVSTGSELGWGPTRMLGGVAFSVGLILVIIAGAELFTGNNLIAMAWASRLISGRQLLRNWFLVYLGNVIGALATVAIVLLARVDSLGDGAVREMAIGIARDKAGLGLMEALARGVLCNALVCVAVWLAMGGRSVADRILAIVLPVTAFVALGLEHSIANWFLIPWGMSLDASGTISFGAFARNIVCSTIGNMLGGTILVAGMYWFIYLRPKSRE